MKRRIISVSLLSADFCNMERDIKMAQDAGVDWLHCDVMDGLFVPNITFGQKMIKDIKKCSKLPLDVHLMIQNPERYIAEFIHSGADIITFHVEATDNIQHCIELIKAHGAKVGLSIKPNTSEEKVFPFLDQIDMVLVMSVEPGFGGQAFMESSLRKINNLKGHLKDWQYLQVDGGINTENAHLVTSAGANSLVAGNSFFKAIDKPALVLALKG